MKTFTIDTDNNITAYTSREAPGNDAGERFSSEEELAKVAADWPISTASSNKIRASIATAWIDRCCNTYPCRNGIITCSGPWRLRAILEHRRTTADPFPNKQYPRRFDDVQLVLEREGLREPPAR